MGIPYRFDPLGTLGASPLPPGYTPADSFRFTSHIKFDISATPTNIIRCIAKHNRYARYGSIFASYKDEATETQRIILAEYDNNAYAYYDTLAANTGTIVELTRGVWHDLTLEANRVTIDDRTYILREPTGHYSGVFGTGTSPTSSYYIDVEYKLFTISDGGVLTHKLVPAISPDLLPCLYDIVARKAYFNA